MPDGVNELLPACLCGSTGAAHGEKHGIAVATCECGIERQRVAMTPGEYAAYYEQDYYGGVYTHSEEQDAAVAERRIAAHGPALRGRVLDIGSGNGAFVQACRKAGLEAWGQEVAPVGPDAFTYRGALSRIHFPTGWADTVTMHDVLEHLIDPVAALAEVARILKPDGKLIVDHPDFRSPDGIHHWKPVEHLWFMTADQLAAKLRQAGFYIVGTDKPIPGKFVLYAEREEEKRPSILVPPGIGDIYWIMVKFRDWLEDLAPEIWIDCPDDRKRSFEFVERIPFVKAGGYHTPWREGMRKWPGVGARKHGYRTGKRSVFPDIEGHDGFVSVNGRMDHGFALDEFLPEHKPNWHMPLFLSLPERDYGARLKAEFGDYIVASFFSAGVYAKWLEELPPKAIYEALSIIHDYAGRKIVLTGAAWDRDSDVNKALLDLDKNEGRLVSLIGETTLGEYFGAVHASSGCLGFPAGNTIMAAAMGKPTGIVWNDHFDRRMHRNACPPWPNYRAFNTAVHTPEEIGGYFIPIVQEKPCP